MRVLARSGWCECWRGTMRCEWTALGVVLLIWNLPLNQLQAWSSSLSPAKVGAVAVGAVLGGIRGSWHTRMLRDLPPKG